MGTDVTTEGDGMRLTYSAPFDFKGSNRVSSRCHIRIWQGRGSLPVVLATELPDNPGQSITNGAEAVASQVWQRLLPEAREGFTWVERYPASQDRRSGRVSADSSLFGESFDLVTFYVVRGHELEMRDDPHPWRRITRAEVEQMIGQALPMKPEEV